MLFIVAGGGVRRPTETAEAIVLRGDGTAGGGVAAIAGSSGSPAC